MTLWIRPRSRHTLTRTSTGVGLGLQCKRKLPVFPTIIIAIFWTLRTTVAQGTAIPLGEDGIQQLVDAHNLFRGMVEPPASNIQRIEWNTELAMVAQAYAETCMFQENTERAQQAPSFDTVGENRAFGRSTNYTDLIERGWFAQRANFDFDNNMCFTQGVCDEYTQLVWADTNLVGCGAALCPTVTGLPIIFNAVVLVCNYAPAGNIDGQLPYISGEACSQCPQGFDFCVENLCSATMAPPTTTEPITTIEPVTMTTTEPPVTTEPLVTTESLTTATPITTMAPPTTAQSSTSPSPSTTDVSQPPTEKPTKDPLTIWQIIWCIIKKKKKPYITVPTSIPERTRSRSRTSGSRRTRTRTSGSSSSDDDSGRSKSRSSRSKRRHRHGRRHRGRNTRRRG